METTIITNKGNRIELDLSESKLLKHFENPTSFTDIIISQINNEKIYEDFLKGENLTIVDIGANVGLFSLFAQDSNQVYSLEPTPSHFELFSNLTKDYKNIKGFNVALNDKDSVVTFFINTENTTMNSLFNKYGDKIEVEGIRLDSFLKKNKIKKVDFVKIDIEGSEMISLTEEVIDAVKDKVKFWFIEAHATDNGDSIEDNRNILIERFGNCGVLLSKFRNDALISN